ncbi:MAG: hypothetical protein JSW00_19810 [Thermoplasmata archaeon]|nr:MAG: hypothetical protein JSW00_19810 [Thermoplasmata archaeon]
MSSKFELLPLVDMDGILTEDERRRIIKRLHSMLSWVGSSIPEFEVIDGITIDLRKAITELILKPELTKEDIVLARNLAKGIGAREHYLEETIIHGDITEEEALALLEEARGLLRAIEELENIEDRGEANQVKETILSKVDDEKRWKQFLNRIKE